MFDDNSKAVIDADAQVLATLLRLAVKSEGKLVVQEELSKIRHDLAGDPNYWVPFGKRIAQITGAAGLD